MLQLQISLLVLWFFLTPVAYSKASVKEQTAPSPTGKPPLVLQWEVSHPRNTDQISLIFKQKTVELVTNTSSYQKNKIVRLGQFESPLNLELKNLKEQVERYYVRLKKTVPISHIIKDPRVRPSIDPHVPVLRINEEEVHNEHPYFKPLASIIYQVWNRQWLCVECAIYKKKRKSIVRTVRKLKNLKGMTDKEKAKDTIPKSQWEEKKQSFPKKLLNCVLKGNKKVECIDPQFGIFEI